MARRSRTTRFAWRWRRNPLRRRSDLVEAWIGLVTVLLICTVPLVGWWAGQSADRALTRVARVQRSERSLVPATVVPASAARGARTAPGAERAVGRQADPAGEEVLRWTAPDGTSRSGKVPLDLEVWHGTRLLLWTDHQGGLVAPPLDHATATAHAALAGVTTAGVAAGALLLARQLLLWRLTQRRMESWDRAWARFGQDWGRAGAGG
ncbi:hypothetical protein [Streptomyces sp. NRRL F-5123]|uniref:Rv1733c family protein n=1 Tax=Streptomyces sp. NRRL F-5123 TaxID=1463856 RepID=UPI0004E231AF|nr:hypothetical protein [Streptomyces sp. NRRL F-5123]